MIKVNTAKTDARVSNTDENTKKLDDMQNITYHPILSLCKAINVSLATH